MSVTLENRLPKPAPKLLPWWLGALLFGAYTLTLNPWVSPASLGQVARAQGLAWIPSLNGPVTFLLTRPFGWLPAPWVPLAMNGFTAGCAALSLVFLARAVMLLPQTVTPERQPWQISFQPPPLLKSRAAWLPPLLAVLMAGLQLSFWQNACAATGEMINLLLFAYVIRCLLEFNVSGRNAWLLRGAFVYGLAVANDWTMAVFCPALVLALIWVKRLHVFNEAFLKQLSRRPHTFKLALLWQIPAGTVAGLSLLLLLPALASASVFAPGDFWLLLKHNFHLDKTLLVHYPRPLLLISGLLSFLPFFLGGLRSWEFPAHQNRLEFLLGPVLFAVVRAFFLLAILWMMFDSPLSPRHLAPEWVSLPLYFLGALNLGCLAGHFLLISEPLPEPAPQRQRRATPMERREQQIRRIFQRAKAGVLPLLGLLTIGGSAALAGKNLPLVIRQRTDACSAYVVQIEQALPPRGAVIVDLDAFRLMYLQSALIRSGRAGDYLWLDAAALTEPGYLDFLKRTQPGFSPELPAAGAVDEHSGNDTLAGQTLLELAKTHAIYCLPPVPLADALGDFFYARPRGLLARLEPWEARQELAAPTPPEILRFNQTFWDNFAKRSLPELVRQINPPPPGMAAGLAGRLLNTLRFGPEPDREARLAGAYYAGALNDWGVELQKARQFPGATPCFAGALQLNPASTAAQINFQFNTNQLARGTEMMRSAAETAGRMNEYGGWQNVLRDGQVDEPNFCFMLGTLEAENHLFRPALAEFDRVRQLAPTCLEADLSLARLFIAREDYVDALTAINDVLAVFPTNNEGLVLLAGVHMRTQAWLAAIPCLTRLLESDPANPLVRMNRARAYHHTGQFAAARQDDTAVIESVTNAFAAYFDLAEMAEQTTNRPAAITNYELFLKYAPANLDEVAIAKARLQVLKPATP